MHASVRAWMNSSRNPDPNELIKVIGRWLNLTVPAKAAEPAESIEHLVPKESAPESKAEPTVSSVPAPGCFNLDQLMRTCFNDEQLAGELLTMFEDRANRSLDAIDEALQREDYESLKKLAHSIKGVAGHLSAEVLFEVSARAERRGRAGDPDLRDFLQDIRQVRSEMSRCLYAAPILRDSMIRI